jgi:hypothetical protein
MFAWIFATVGQIPCRSPLLLPYRQNFEALFPQAPRIGDNGGLLKA